METPISKSQKRAMSLLGLAAVDSYSAAAGALETAGCYGSGLGPGLDWRSAAKLSDADLVAQIRRTYDDCMMSAAAIIEYGY